jgi:hypothetical protein
MSILRSLSKAVKVPLDAITETGTSVSRGIGVMNKYVELNARRLESSMEEEAIMEEATFNVKLVKSLKADPLLEEQYLLLKEKYGSK